MCGLFRVCRERWKQTAKEMETAVILLGCRPIRARWAYGEPLALSTRATTRATTRDSSISPADNFGFPYLAHIPP